MKKNNCNNNEKNSLYTITGLAYLKRTNVIPLYTFGTIQRSQRWCHQHCYLAVASYDKLSQMELLFFSSYEIKSISVRKLFEKLKAFRSIWRHKSFSWIWTDSQVSLSFNIHQAALSNLPQLIKRQDIESTQVYEQTCSTCRTNTLYR